MNITSAHHKFQFYQYALSDSISEAASPFKEVYSLISCKPLKIPSTAKSEGALVVGSSSQQLSSNFFILYSTYSISNLFKRSMAFIESSDSSTSRTGFRLTTTVYSNI